MKINAKKIQTLNVLEPVDSFIDGKTIKEKVDLTILNKLIHSDLLQITFSNHIRELFYENEKTQLLAYKKLVKQGFASVKYSKAKGSPYGRCNPQKGLGLFNIRKPTRQTLAKGSYIDIDIENCHPVILYNLCIANNWKCQELENYINNREKWLKKVREDTKCTDKQAKNLYIELLYFGSYESWKKEFKLEATTEPTQVKKFKDEVQKIGNNIYNANPKIQKIVEKRKEEQKKKNYNKIGSVVSYYLQEIENRILELLLKYCYDNIENKDVYIPCADGFMIPSELYNDDLINKFEKMINETYGFVLKIVKKEMKDDYLDILDDHVLKSKDEMIVEEQYQMYKDIVEKKYFMVNKPCCFGYLDNENKLQLESYRNMKDIILKTYNFSKKNDKGKEIGFNFIEKWTSDINRRIYEGIVFEPNKTEEELKGYYNLFTGFEYESVNYEEKKDDVEEILKFIKSLVIDDEKCYNYLIEWIARIIQLKTRTEQSVILYSHAHGVGKSFIHKLISNIFGKKYVTVIKTIEEISKEFNSQFENKFLIYADEIKAKSSNLYDDLKNIITAPTININRKGIESFQTSNYNNLIFTTNTYNMCKIEKDDRRLTIIDCVEKPFSDETYIKLHKYLENTDVMASLFNYFKNYKLSETFKVISTEHKRDLQDFFMPTAIKYVYTHINTLLRCGTITSLQLFSKIKEYEKTICKTDCSSPKEMNIKLNLLGIAPKRKTQGMIYTFDRDAINKLKNYNEDLFEQYYVEQEVEYDY